MTEATKKNPALIAYNVTKRGEKDYWNRIGAAWMTKSGGYRVRLETIPVNGEIVLHPPKTAK
jgi:hypothetical protein